MSTKPHMPRHRPNRARLRPDLARNRPKMGQNRPSWARFRCDPKSTKFNQNCPGSGRIRHGFGQIWPERCGQIWPTRGSEQRICPGTKIEQRSTGGGGARAAHEVLVEPPMLGAARAPLCATLLRPPGLDHAAQSPPGATSERSELQSSKAPKEPCWRSRRPCRRGPLHPAWCAAGSPTLTSKAPSGGWGTWSSTTGGQRGGQFGLQHWVCQTGVWR